MSERPPAPSTPPSEPRPGSGSFGSRPRISAIDLAERPARLQMIIALVLGLVLVTIPLYLWRRPRTEPNPVKTAESESGATASATLTAVSVPAPVSTDAGAAKVTVSDPRVTSCHDPGPKRTAPEDCDHVTVVEKSLADAIVQNASCVADGAGGGTITYEADVSFLRKKNPIVLSVPRDERSLKSAHAAASCASRVKDVVTKISLDGVAHQHARYKIVIVATYAGAP